MGEAVEKEIDKWGVAVRREFACHGWDVDGVERWSVRSGLVSFEEVAEVGVVGAGPTVVGSGVDGADVG